MKKLLFGFLFFVFLTIVNVKISFAQTATCPANTTSSCALEAPASDCFSAGACNDVTTLYCCPTSQNTVTKSEPAQTFKCPNSNKQGIDTAIGCVPFGDINDSSSIIAFLLRWAIGVGGGIAFLLILYAGFQIMTSSGDPNKLKAGQELLTAAISGIIMLIFSVFILKVIGVDILKIF